MAQVPLATQADLEGTLESVVAGTNVTITGGDPRNPVINATGGGGGGGSVDEVAAGTGIEVDATDPSAPVVAVDSATQAALAAAGTAVQPDDLALVATTGSYADLTARPTLGTAAAADTGDFDPAGSAAAAQSAAVSTANGYTDSAVGAVTPAGIGAATAAQGALADTAVQPAELEDLDTTHWRTYEATDDARVGAGKVEVWIPVPPTLGDPENAAVDDIVLRTTPGAGTVLVDDDGTYEAVGGRSFIGATEPSGTMVDGDRWIDPVNAVQYVWWGVEWVLIAGTAPDPTAPGQVTGLTATPGDGEVALEWAAPSTGGSAITDYVVERAPDDSGAPGTWATLSDGTSTATAYTDDTAVNDSTYWYRISATNAVGTGDPSDAVSATPTAPPPSAGPTIVTQDAVSYNATPSPVVTIDGYDPVENDIVFAFVGSTTIVTAAIPTGWVSVVADPFIVVPGDTTVVGMCLYHVVTAGEESAETNSWTLTDLFNTTEIGEIIAVVVRSADTTTVVDDFGTYFNESTSVTHVLPGLEGDNLSDNSLVLAVTFPDGLQTYATPAGWSPVETTTGTNMGGAVFQLDTLTEVGVDIPPTDVTASGLDEAVGITVAILVAS